MDFLQAVVLGVLQGVFEWLPVSSQGQTIGIAVGFFGISSAEALKHAVFLHAGTLLAAAIYFRKEIIQIISGQLSETRNFIFVAVPATAVTALPSYLLLKSFLFSSFALLVLIGLLLLFTGFIQRIKPKGINGELNRKNSVLLGLAQGFSVLPGVSRSGITSSALLLRGFSPEKAFRLSFLLSIPSVFLAEISFGFLEGFSFEFNSLVALAFAFAFGLLSIDLLLKAAKRISFSKFCYAFGLIYLGIAVASVL